MDDVSGGQRPSDSFIPPPRPSFRPLAPRHHGSLRLRLPVLVEALTRRDKEQLAWAVDEMAPVPVLAAFAEGQALADRRFNRRRYNAARTIDAFSVRLRDQLDLDTLTTELLTVLDQTIEPTTSSLWLRPQATPVKPGPGRSLDMRWSIAGTRPRPFVQASPARHRNCRTR